MKKMKERVRCIGKMNQEKRYKRTRREEARVQNIEKTCKRGTGNKN